MRFKDELKKYFVYRFGGFICALVMGIILFMTSAVPPKSWAIPGSFEMFLLMTLWTFLLLWRMDKWLD